MFIEKRVNRGTRLRERIARVGAVLKSLWGRSEALPTRYPSFEPPDFLVAETGLERYQPMVWEPDAF